MSPLKKKKLNIIRKKLDKLDNTLINIIKKRTLLVKEVIKLKEFKKEIVDKKRINLILNNIKKRTNLVKKVLELKESKNQIIDQKRIKYILKNIRKKSLKNGIDPKITNRIWKNMIWSYIDFEKRNFKKK